MRTTFLNSQQTQTARQLSGQNREKEDLLEVTKKVQQWSMIKSRLNQPQTIMVILLLVLQIWNMIIMILKPHRMKQNSMKATLMELIIISSIKGITIINLQFYKMVSSLIPLDPKIHWKNATVSTKAKWANQSKFFVNRILRWKQPTNFPKKIWITQADIWININSISQRPIIKISMLMIKKTLEETLSSLLISAT